MKRISYPLLNLVSALLLAGSAATMLPARAADTTTPAISHAQQLKQSATTRARQVAKEKATNFNAEAVAAIREVEQAEKLLDANRHEEAVGHLETAAGKLEVAMAADPDLKLITVAANVFTYDMLITPEQVKAELAAVEKDLAADNAQAARIRLGQLRSEITTNYIYLPVETYPAAIRQAVREIADRQYVEARTTLDLAMDSLVEEAETTPLPVILAHGAILDAEEHQSTDREKALQELDFASEQMQTAELLGYFYNDKAAYTETMRHIDDLRHVMGGASRIETLFADAKTSIKHLIDRFSTRKPVARTK